MPQYGTMTYEIPAAALYIDKGLDLKVTLVQRSDANGDGQVTVTDIGVIVDMILGTKF